MTGHRVGAVLCDLDGVVRVWGGVAAEVARVAFRAERLWPAVTGRVTDEEWRAGVVDDLVGLGSSVGDARAAVAAWGRQAVRVDAEVLALLGEVRRRVPVVLVTNGTTRLESDLALLGLESAFDAVVNSARVGAAKPEAAIYRAAAGRAGVAVGRCLFVDDTAANVAAAQALGMRGHHHRDAAVLRRELEGCGLLAAG